MNARQMLAKLDGYGGIIPFNSEELDVTLRALRLLAAAEGGEGTPETDIATMVTLCRLAPNEAADAIESGDHNDSDIEAVIHWVRHFPDAATLIEALHSERNALAARVAELEADKERLDWAERQWADGIHIEKCAIGKCSGDRLEPSAAVYVGDEFQADTIRAAIDAARSK